MRDDRGASTARPAHRLLPASEKQSSYLLEVFESFHHSVGPTGTTLRQSPGESQRADHGANALGVVVRHAVWLHCLKSGGYRWECSCGAQRASLDLDGGLLLDARAHFEPMAAPVGHPLAVGNDRVKGKAPPSAADLEGLAKALRSLPRREL